MKDIAASILVWLKNQAKETGLSYQMLQEAIWQTVQHRGTVYKANSFERIAAFGDNPFLLAQWMRFQPSMQVQLPELESILYRLKEFFQPVFEASIKEREFFMDWSVEQKKWQEQSFKGKAD